jgi:hypothetical protein
LGKESTTLLEFDAPGNTTVQSQWKNQIGFEKYYVATEKWAATLILASEAVGRFIAIVGGGKTRG